jgi:hypothetical protein
MKESGRREPEGCSPRPGNLTESGLPGGHFSFFSVPPSILAIGCAGACTLPHNPNVKCRNDVVSRSELVEREKETQKAVSRLRLSPTLAPAIRVPEPREQTYTRECRGPLPLPHAPLPVRLHRPPRVPGAPL